MPNRILRDWTDSEPVNALDPWAERTFTRLIMKADDYGRLRGEAKLLRPLLYPLLLDQVREADLSRQLHDLERAGLVRFYAVEGKQYLEIRNFRQQVRSPSKCPEPPSVAEHPPSRCAADDAHLRTKAQAHSKAQTEAQNPPNPPSGGTRAGDVPKTAKGVPIPLSLASPDFLAAWAEWEAHLREKRIKTTSLADKRQLAECEKWGVERSVRYVAHAIAKNWRGLFPPKGEEAAEPKPETASGPPENGHFVRAPYTEELARTAGLPWPLPDGNGGGE